MLSEQLPKIITAELPGPQAAEVIRRRAVSTPKAIGCSYPCVMKRAAGAMIEDVDGNVFLDWIGGVGVLNIGHCHPEVVQAVQEQSSHYFHGMFNVVTHAGYVSLAEKLNEIVPVKGIEKQTMLANSGAEAIENAVKIAKAFTKRPNIIVFSSAFHGRTLLAMAMTAKKAYAAGMGPFPDGVCRAEYPYLYRKPSEMTDEEAIRYYVNSLKKVFEEVSPAHYVAAVVIEPLQGEGGFIPVPFEYIKELRKICNEHGILLIADEIQSGFGRTGKMYASNYWAENGVCPDIITSAKSIGGGVPLSAITARKEIFDAVPGGVIGGTYGGNALACAASLKILEIIQRDGLLARSAKIGEIYRKTMEAWMEQYEVIGDVRGLGGMVGVEFVTDKRTKTPNPQFVSRLIAEATKRGLLIEVAGTYGNVIRFLAPLVMTDAQLAAGLDIFKASIDASLRT
jgi:4-aminobutyrate aminotransferase / (S)-3-amino-2-methylpropionate transaminase / 5-aminovalerate transaminase